jgi:hypothetical protein
MANKKINELVTRTPSLSDLILVGDPSSGYSYKATVTALATIIETDIADGFVTLSTTQTISGAKTFSNNLTLTSVANAATTQTKFLTLNGSNVVNYRTGAEVLADIGGQGTLTLTTTGTSGAATLVGNTLNIPQYQSTLTNPVTGTGTTNYLPKFTGSTTIGNSQLIDNGTTVFLGTSGTLPNVKMIISTTSQRALELNSTSGNALFVSSGGAFVMTVTNGTWSSQFTQAGRLELGGDLSITTIANATTDTDKFLVSDSGVLKYRTGAEVLSDIGGASSASISGTTNYIPKFTSSSAIGNSVIYELSGNIGLGTTNPSDNIGYGRALDIQSSTGAAVYLRDSDATTTQYAFVAYDGNDNGLKINNQNSSGFIRFSPNGTEGMRLTSTGLGIGTSSPASKLDVAGNTRVGGSGNPSLTISGTDGAYTGLFYINASGGGASKIFANGGTNTLQLGTNNTERLTLDASGNLGLGVTPSAWGFITPLQIKNSTFAGYTTGTTHITYTASNWYLNGSGVDTYIANGAATLYSQSSGQHAWYNAPSGTAGNAISFTQAMTLDASGRLGIGTTSPTQKLHVSVSSGAVVGLLESTGTSGEATWRLAGKNSTGTTRTGNWKYDNSDYLRFGTPDAIALAFETNDTERMRITSSGNIGIGTTSPSGKLHLSSTGDTYLVMTGGSTPLTYSWLVDATSLRLFTGVGDTERMRITSAGRVLIGTTTDAGSPFNLQVGGRILQTGTEFGFSGDDDKNITVFSNRALNLRTNDATRMTITSGGEVYIAGTTDQGAYNLQVNGTGVWGAGAYVNGSDSSLKENIQNMGSALNLVNQLQPKTYTYKPSYSKDSTIQVGFIAQDLEQVLANQNYKGSIVVDGPNFKSVAYQNLIPLLVQSIKELKAEIETLKNK